MRARELEFLLARLGVRSVSDLDIRGRMLREAKILPTGGRGPHAPHITAEHAAAVIISALGPGSEARQAVEVVNRYGQAIAADETLAGGGTLWSALTSCLLNSGIGEIVGQVTFVNTPDEQLAQITQWAPGEGRQITFTYRPADQLAECREEGRNPAGIFGLTGDTKFVSGYLLQMIAQELAGAKDD